MLIKFNKKKIVNVKKLTFTEIVINNVLFDGDMLCQV